MIKNKEILMVLLYILLFSLLGSVGSLVGGILLLKNYNAAKRISLFLVSFATGTLLGTSFFGLLPEAAGTLGLEKAMSFSVAGIVLFFILEKVLILHHHHAHDKKSKKEKHIFNYLLLVGDTVHNFIDGIIIAVSFLVSFPLGIISSLGVISHEIPQEIGDFSILLHGKMEKKKILIYNLLSALSTPVGAVLTFFFIDFISPFSQYLIALAAGFFIYIAGSDLIPETHSETRWGKSFGQATLLVLGVILIWLLENFLRG